MLFIVCSLQSYVPTVFENYTASFEIDTQRIELSLWDTSGNYDLPFLLPSFLPIASPVYFMLIANQFWCNVRTCPNMQILAQFPCDPRGHALLFGGVRGEGRI